MQTSALSVFFCPPDDKSFRIVTFLGMIYVYLRCAATSEHPQTCNRHVFITVKCILYTSACSIILTKEGQVGKNILLQYYSTMCITKFVLPTRHRVGSTEAFQKKQKEKEMHMIHH